MSENENEKDLGDKAKDFADKTSKEAKKTADEFKEGVKDTFDSNDNKKILVGILAIVVGGFGIHKFILGYNKEGIIMLVATLILGGLTCGMLGWVVWVIGLIEGIIYLTKSDEEFYNTYQVGKKPWF
ncbi:TM2 domain-containing protein [Galbibacter sp. EGI 63066]|uniref:TM2 domain-containing protein n=1 Tax=Galbibacter sp. EGI 63066 TaxID=2993559 RepID=UPI002248FB00|nr:TM2 domain-containing protein [Galbibacter sp. EGI 63066]MCX2681104.1 TM2 domain-containing protein [Galbibacter sp. EGI 63066]